MAVYVEQDLEVEYHNGLYIPFIALNLSILRESRLAFNPARFDQRAAEITGKAGPDIDGARQNYQLGYLVFNGMMIVFPAEVDGRLLDPMKTRQIMGPSVDDKLQSAGLVTGCYDRNSFIRVIQAGFDVPETELQRVASDAYRTETMRPALGAHFRIA